MEVKSEYQKEKISEVMQGQNLETMTSQGGRGGLSLRELPRSHHVVIVVWDSPLARAIKGDTSLRQRL